MTSRPRKSSRAARRRTEHARTADSLFDDRCNTIVRLTTTGDDMQYNWDHIAGLVWNKLVERANLRKDITYRELGESVGIHWRSVRYALDRIQNYCLTSDILPLTVLVVRGGDRKPGAGFIAAEPGALDITFNEVCSFNWQEVKNPFTLFNNNYDEKHLIKSIVSRKYKEVPRSIVEQRGLNQYYFRQALRKIYQDKCAFCEFGFPEALEGAHIVPWCECVDDDRINLSNGILLCANHHRLFDCRIIEITEDYTIKYHGMVDDFSYYSDFDKIMTCELHGRPVRLPSNPEDYPGLDFIRRRTPR